MASAELSRHVEKLVGYPPLSELSDLQRREFHEALLEAGTFEDLPGKWQAAILQAEQNRPKLRVAPAIEAARDQEARQDLRLALNVRLARVGRQRVRVRARARDGHLCPDDRASLGGVAGRRRRRHRRPPRGLRGRAGTRARARGGGNMTDEFDANEDARVVASSGRSAQPRTPSRRRRACGRCSLQLSRTAGSRTWRRPSHGVMWR
jgi:hypothetical protein